MYLHFLWNYGKVQKDEGVKERSSSELCVDVDGDKGKTKVFWLNSAGLIVVSQFTVSPVVSDRWSDGGKCCPVPCWLYSSLSDLLRPAAGGHSPQCRR